MFTFGLPLQKYFTDLLKHKHIFACGGGNICYNDHMNKIVSVLKKYMYVVAIFITVSIVLNVSFSNFFVTSNNNKAAEMYIGELKYSINIEGENTNILTVPTGETIIDVKVKNLNSVDTYYKLLYLNNTNVTIKYYESTTDTYTNITNYDKPSGSIIGNNSNNIKLLITNSSTSSQSVSFTMKGGYITNTLKDVTIPSDYSEITLVETPSANTYFCLTTATLEQGYQFLDSIYTYSYKQEQKQINNIVRWANMDKDGWGVVLTDKKSTKNVSMPICTYINNKPVVSMSYMFNGSNAKYLNLGSSDANYNTSKVTNMKGMFANTDTKSISIDSFDTSNVTDMSEMFYMSKVANLVDINVLNLTKVLTTNRMFFHSTIDYIDFGATTSSVNMDMSYMFAGVTTDYISLDQMNLRQVATMEKMFYQANVADTIWITDVYSYYLNNVTDMFTDCTVKTIDLSGSTFTTLKSISKLFYNNSATTLNLDGITFRDLTNITDVFKGSKATTINLNNTRFLSLTNMSELFYNNQNVKTINMSGMVANSVTSLSNMFLNCTADEINMSNAKLGKVTSMYTLFYHLSPKIINLSGLTAGSLTEVQNLFYESNVDLIDLSNASFSSLTSTRSMFNGVNATTVDLSNMANESVTYMGAMFSESSIDNLILKNFNTSNVINMSGMFSGVGTNTLDLSSFDTSKVTNMTYMFNTTGIKTIYVSSKFNTSNVTSSDFMFSNSSKLVGGAGTTYNSSYVDKTYARIDTASTPGYFTDEADKPAEPNSFSTDSWATIVNAVRTNNTSKYNVGDTKTVDMGTYGTHTLRISNMSTPTECSTSGFSQTACGFVLEFEDIITTKAMNSTDSNVGGWSASSMYTFVNNDIYNSLPIALKDGIINTVTISGHGNTSGEENFTSTDKIYLLSTGEVWADGASSFTWDSARTLTRQLDYYKMKNVTTSNYGNAIKENEGSAGRWWLRSTNSGNFYTFFIVNTNGNWYNFNASYYTSGVSPAFRIG